LSPRQRSKARRSTILVVDDEPGIVDVMIAVLEDAGHDASGANNGREALSKLEASQPDLLLLDLEMPVLDGAATLSAMKANPRLASVPVLMMSGITESMVKRRCRGYDAFLRKPFSLDDLLDTLDTLLGDAAGRRKPDRPRAKRATSRKK
jgi:CheY-like chemotaxis protein